MLCSLKQEGSKLGEGKVGCFLHYCTPKSQVRVLNGSDCKSYIAEQHACTVILMLLIYNFARAVLE